MKRAVQAAYTVAVILLLAVSLICCTDIDTTASSSTTQTQRPAAPINITAVAGAGQVTVNWNPVSGATSYNVYYGTAAGLTKETGAGLVNVSSPYSVTGLALGTTYYFTVTAVNTVGESAASSEVTATPTVRFAASQASVAAGAKHTLAIATDGTVWAWGSNRHGQLGNGTYGDVWGQT
jgi:hypothetical protein